MIGNKTPDSSLIPVVKLAGSSAALCITAKIGLPMTLWVIHDTFGLGDAAIHVRYAETPQISPGEKFFQRRGALRGRAPKLGFGDQPLVIKKERAREQRPNDERNSPTPCRIG